MDCKNMASCGGDDGDSGEVLLIWFEGCKAVTRPVIILADLINPHTADACRSYFSFGYWIEWSHFFIQSLFVVLRQKIVYAEVV